MILSCDHLLGDHFDNVGMILLMILDAFIAGPTRARGFWQNHAAYVQAVLEGYRLLE